MEKITFECEVITPMFLAGADGVTPELRAPSIKGALRFWWRALNGHLSLSDLKKKEAEIFGGTNPARRSSILLNVSPNEIPRIYQVRGDELQSKYPDYFFFTISIQQQKTKEGDFYKKGIKAGFKFSIELKSRRISDLKEAVKAFYLLVYLGGLGTRTRRGAGAIRVVEIKDLKHFLKSWDISFQGTFKKSIATIQSTNNKSIGNKFSSLVYANFYQSEGNFRLGKEAIHAIAYRMKIMRENNTAAEDNTFKQSDLNKKAAFGLPIGVRKESESVNFSDTDKNNRRASQFFISVYAIDNNKVKWIVTKFNDDFMPPNQTIKFKNFEWNEPNFSLAQKFIDELHENKLS